MPYDSGGNWVGPSSLGLDNMYGYAQAPGQPGYGYYEQQTPAGSFAAANQQFAAGQQQQPTMYGRYQGASNPYIGQQARGVGGQGSVLPYAQQAAGYAQERNPFMGQHSQQAQQAGTNPYAGSNPFLQQSIDSSLGDIAKNFNNVTRPAMDAAQRASGSFGNSALLEQQGNAYGDLAGEMGRVASGMRMQDYGMQQQLGESALNRQQQVNLTNAGMSAADLARNMGGFYQGQSLGLQGLAGLQNAAQFDANLGQQGGMFNAGQQNQMGQFNGSQAQQLGMFNAGQQQNAGFQNAGIGNAANQFWGNLGQQNSQFNAGQGNAMNMFNTGAGNGMLEGYRNRTQQQGQFDANLDYNIDNSNWNRGRTGMRDAMDIYDRMLGYTDQQYGLGTQQQNMPLWYQQQFGNMATQYGGLGGTNTNSQTSQGNPWLGAIGGWMTGGNLYNNWGG